jgi:hypothetical protein
VNTAVLAKYLFIAGTLPFILLGTMHWVYTFMDMKRPRKFAPRDDVARLAMQATTMNISNGTTVWKAWMGFHHSHSIGAIFFGLIFLILALQDFGALVDNTVLMRLATVVPLIYLWVSRRFWFLIPTLGIGVSAACMIAAFLLTL